jgi:hypothetical protein
MTKSMINPKVTNKDAPDSYASVNGLKMYHEVHGNGRPLVLLHVAVSAIDTSFGQVLPSLASTRQIIAVEQQAHGRTAALLQHTGGWKWCLSR